MSDKYGGNSASSLAVALGSSKPRDQAANDASPTDDDVAVLGEDTPAAATAAAAAAAAASL
tara:strand:- start:2553 stop:2735 length:183 start_codon:yes stop_codon:yes gene_type:complete